MTSSFAPTAEPGDNLTVAVASHDVLAPVHFSVQERMSTLFMISLEALSRNADIDLDAVVGQPARFAVRTRHPEYPERVWTGICSHLQQVGIEPDGASTYRLTIVPDLWLATQRRNHRMFQQKSEPEIVLQMLDEWGIAPRVLFDRGAYKKRKYRVQYAESDYTFMCRMLEDAGISFFFAQEDGQSRLVLTDAPQRAEPRARKIPFRDTPMSTTQDNEFVTDVRVAQQVRPGKYTLRDHDYRRPAGYKLLATAKDGGSGVEDRLERFHYTPGAFLFASDKGDDSPVADDKGKHRTDEAEGAALAQKRLEAKRANARVITFETNAFDLAPGVVMSMLDHPRTDLHEDKRLLLVESTFSGTARGDWTHACEARPADRPFRPPLDTPKPKISGVESATVVGPPGEEIHTDEFGRVRVHFHWDRESQMDDNSSCWIHVSQPWGGAGYGGTNLPRVGQEVLVDFLGGDPDRPVITGRVYTNLQKTPYKLPANKTQSGWKSNSTQRTGGYNEIMFEDAAGRELVRMQAEKDFFHLTKHDSTTTTRHDRSIWTGHDDTETVVHKQTVFVGDDRTVLVMKDQQHAVLQNITQTAANGFAWHKSKDMTIIESDKSILLHVGDDSYILIEAGKITIQAPRVEINPASGGGGGE